MSGSTEEAVRPGTHFGRTELPEEQKKALRKAKALQWFGLFYLISCVVVVYLVMGSSQAMKVAWVEDLLSLVPVISFLLATRIAARQPDGQYPYGRHRAVAIGHLVASVALLAMGLFLIYDSATGLITGEHPPLATMRLFGHTFWSGWLMIAAMVYTGTGPVILGRMKLPLAKKLHDKVLHADADMNKADWTSASAAILGILGIGMGLWWADAVAALVIAVGIVKDGVTNVGHATAALMDSTARTVDDADAHPLVHQVEGYLSSRPWIADHRFRLRDLGHVFHLEVQLVPRGGRVDLDRLEQAAVELRDLDWKLEDVTLAPVRSLDEVPSSAAAR